MRDINGAHLEGELKEYLYDMWKNNVPHVLWNSSEPDFESDKCLNECHSILLQPLEKFICSDDNPNEYINNLQTATNSTVLCGKLFKTGEPIYTCRECANNPNIVLCNDCFQRSIHKSHQYEMYCASEGGYCDCGDEEAWKEGAHCLTHAPVTTSDEETDPLDSLPATLRTRAIDVFAIILEYVEKHLSTEIDDFPDQFFAPSDSTLTDSYCTMIFNDETHSLNSVIESLSKAIDCDPTKASHLASAIDREGRMSVKVSNKSTCAEVKRKFDGYIKEETPHSHLRNHKPLRVSVLHRDLVAYQTFAYELLKWLSAFVVKLDGLRNLFCKLVLDLPEISGLKYLERIIINDTKLWKSVRICWHTVFTTTFLMNRDYKKTFSSYFVKHYNRIHKEFSVDDHEHGVSISSLSGLIFSFPSISRFLISECNALEIVIDTLTEFCVMTRPTSGQLYVLDKSAFKDKYLKYSCCIFDIKCLLLNQPIWNADVYEKFFRAYDIFLNLLTSLQDMDSVVRETKSHIVHLPEWESAMMFQIAVDGVLRQLREWCSSNDELLKRCLQKAIEYLFINEASTFVGWPITVGWHQHECIDHVVEIERVSIHQPLTRFIGGLCLHLEKHQMKITDDAFTTMKQVDRFPHYLEILMEKSLRAIVLTTQVYAGMWPRNYSLQNQILFYQSNRCRGEMFDKDIVMIQVVAASLHPDDFLCALINKFSLTKWFSPNYEYRSHEDIQKFNISFVEDLLHLLIMIVCQRYVIGVGKNVTIDAVIEEHLIHHLAIAPLTHSELITMLPIEMSEHPRLEEVLNSITNFTQNNGKGTFALQNSMYYRFNPLSYHLLRNDLTKAEEKLLKIRSSLNETIPALMPPHLPRFSNNFKAINEVFESEVFLYMIHLIFKRLLSSFGRFSSETIAFRALFLVCTGLSEEEKYFKTDDSFDLSLKIQTYKPNETCDNTILSLFNKLLTSSRMDSCRDLLKYVIQLTQDLISKKLDPSKKMETFVVPDVTEDSSVEETLPQRNESDIAAQFKLSTIMAECIYLDNEDEESIRFIINKNTISSELENIIKQTFAKGTPANKIISEALFEYNHVKEYAPNSCITALICVYHKDVIKNERLLSEGEKYIYKLVECKVQDQPNEIVKFVMIEKKKLLLDAWIGLEEYFQSFVFDTILKIKPLRSQQCLYNCYNKKIKYQTIMNFIYVNEYFCILLPEDIALLIEMEEHCCDFYHKLSDNTMWSIIQNNPTNYITLMRKEQFMEINVVGTGGSGVCIILRDAEQQKEFVAKKLKGNSSIPHSSCGSSSARLSPRSGLLKEAAALRCLYSIKNANIVNPHVIVSNNTECALMLFSYENEELEIFITMEYIDGIDLQDAPLDKMDFSTKFYIAVKIAEVLNVLHLNGYAHTDIHTKNIRLLKNTSTPIVLDLGSCEKTTDFKKDISKYYKILYFLFKEKNEGNFDIDKGVPSTLRPFFDDVIHKNFEGMKEILDKFTEISFGLTLERKYLDFNIYIESCLPEFREKSFFDKRSLSFQIETVSRDLISQNKDLPGFLKEQSENEAFMKVARKIRQNTICEGRAPTSFDNDLWQQFFKEIYENESFMKVVIKIRQNEQSENEAFVKIFRKILQNGILESESFMKVVRKILQNEIMRSEYSFDEEVERKGMIQEAFQQFQQEREELSKKQLDKIQALFLDEN